MNDVASSGGCIMLCIFCKNVLYADHRTHWFTFGTAPHVSIIGNIY
jgi:hypothetical protein